MSSSRRQPLCRSSSMATPDGTPPELQTHNPARCLSYVTTPTLFLCSRQTDTHTNANALGGYLPPTKEEVHFLSVFVCLSVCLLARLLKNECMDLDEMLRVDRCRDMDELINFWARSADHSLDAGTGLLSSISYRLRNFAALPRLPASCAATRNFTSGKSHVYVLAARR